MPHESYGVHQCFMSPLVHQFYWMKHVTQIRYSLWNNTPVLKHQHGEMYAWTDRDSSGTSCCTSCGCGILWCPACPSYHENCRGVRIENHMHSILHVSGS
ncbi:hypothetical protein X943_003312 [Babesia divergens]|uniref:Uncharacterized protein n=1 Tax=Babesia divergens TaxID=32595 RepID=A0AAD9GG33_BABDI|nr:hypothetical protein X943_003312 [Babesia divergens]